MRNNNRKTVRPTSIATFSETIILASEKATVTPIRKARRNRDLSWLLKATSSVAVDYRS